MVLTGTLQKLSAEYIALGVWLYWMLIRWWEILLPMRSCRLRGIPWSRQNSLVQTESSNSDHATGAQWARKFGANQSWIASCSVTKRHCKGCCNMESLGPSYHTTYSTTTNPAGDGSGLNPVPSKSIHAHRSMEGVLLFGQWIQLPHSSSWLCDTGK